MAANVKNIILQARQQGIPDQQILQALQQQGLTGQPQQQQQSSGIGGFFSNLASSAGNVVSGIGNALFHPIDTAKALGKTALGGVEELGNFVQGKQSDTSNSNIQAFEGLKNYFGQRYGSIDALKNTLYKDPVGAALDLASVLEPAGGLISGAGKLADVSEIAKAGDIVAGVGKAVDPINAASKVIGGVVGGGAKLAKTATEGLLGTSTGAGFESTSRVADYAGDPAFTAAMRGRVSGQDILTKLKSIMSSMSLKATDEFGSKLGAIANEQVDYAPVQAKIQEFLKQYNINIAPAEGEVAAFAKEFNIPEGSIQGGIPKSTEVNLDFSKSPFRNVASAQSDIKEVVNALYNQSSDTVRNAQFLKQSMSNYFGSSKLSNGFFAKVQNSLRQELGKIPGYNTMAAEYETRTALLSDLKKSFSTGDKAATETGIKKIISAARDNNDFKRSLLEELQAQGQPNLMKSIVGTQFASKVPRGISKYAAEGALSVAAFHLNPVMLATLFLASPRLVGEMLNVIGLTGKQIAKVRNLAMSVPGAELAIKNARPALRTGVLVKRVNTTQNSP